MGTLKRNGTPQSSGKHSFYHENGVGLTEENSFPVNTDIPVGSPEH